MDFHKFPFNNVVKLHTVVYKKFCLKVNEKELPTNYINELSAILSSHAFRKSVGKYMDVSVRKLTDFCELFGADIDKTEEVANIIGEEL